MCPFQATSWNPEPVQLIFRILISHIFNSLVRWGWIPVVLCRKGKSQFVFSVKVPLYAQLLNGLCSFLYGLVIFPGWTARGLFSNEQNYKLYSLPGHRRKSSSKACKTLCCLKSSWPMLHVPWSKRATDFSLKTISFAYLPFGSCDTGVHNFQEMHQSFAGAQLELKDTYHGRWIYVTDSLPGQE